MRIVGLVTGKGAGSYRAQINREVLNVRAHGNQELANLCPNHVRASPSASRAIARVDERAIVAKFVDERWIAGQSLIKKVGVADCRGRRA